MQLYCEVSQSKLVMGVKRPEGLLVKRAVLAPQVPPTASPPRPLNCFSFPHKMSPTKPESAQLSLLGNQSEYKRCKLLRWPQLRRENSVQLWSRLWLTPGSGPAPPSPPVAHPCLPLTPHSSALAAPAVPDLRHCRRPNAFLPHPRRQVPARPVF